MFIKIKNKMPKLISDITRDYEQMYDITFTKDVHLIIGLYGSNAFTYRQIIPEIAFCLEKLSLKIAICKLLLLMSLDTLYTIYYPKKRC